MQDGFCTLSIFQKEGSRQFVLSNPVSADSSLNFADRFIDIDLHIHTKYSPDSSLEPKNAIKQAIKVGLSAIAITDHNTMKGITAVRKLKLQTKDLIMVPGMEVRTEKGDLVALFIESELHSRNFVEVLDEVKQQDGILVLPHPFRSHKSLNELTTAVDMIEAFNGRRPLKENELAFKLTTDLKKPALSSSDAHFSFEIGGVKTRLYADVQNLEDLRRKLLAGNKQLIFVRPLVKRLGAHYLSVAVQLLKGHT